MLLKLTDSQKSNLSVAFKTAKGNPAKIDGVPTWSITDEAVASILPAEDGLTAELVAHLMGTAQVSVTADADLGEGFKTIAGSLDVEVISAEAAVVEITPGEPIEQ